MRTCIITGAGAGIGRATALALAASDSIQNYVLIALGMDDLEETKRLMGEVTADGDTVTVYDQDLTKYDEVKAIIDDVYKKTGRIDILLNIAGYSKPEPFLDVTLETFQKTFAINVTALFAITQAAVRYMKETGGVIVNTASTAGTTPRPLWLSYASSKSAVIGFSRTLTQEVKDFGIKVFNISPGRCATAMRRIVAPDEDQSKIMKPESVANMFAFFVNNPDCDIDGQDIIVRELD